MSFGWKDSVVIRTNYLTKEERMTQIFLARGEGVLCNKQKKLGESEKRFPLVQWYAGTRDKSYQKSEKHM